MANPAPKQISTTSRRCDGVLSGYMGSGTTFDDTVGEFAVDYSDQNRSDYRAFVRAIREGRIKTLVEG